MTQPVYSATAVYIFSTFSSPNTPREEEPTGETHVEQNHEATGMPGSHEELQHALLQLAPRHKAPGIFEHFCSGPRRIHKLFSKPLKRINQRRGERQAVCFEEPCCCDDQRNRTRAWESLCAGSDELLQAYHRKRKEERSLEHKHCQTPLCLSLFKLFNELSA